MALKQFYATKDEVPTEQQSFYAPKDGKYELQVEGVNSISAVLTKNSELLAQHSTDKTEITRLTGEVSRLTTEMGSAQTLPAGHVAIPKADARYVELKSLGTTDEIRAKVTEHGALAEEKTKTERQKKLREAASAHGFDPDKIAALEDRFTEPFSREVTEGTKKVNRYYFKVKEGDKEVERSFEEFVEKDEKLSPLAKDLKAQSGGTPWPKQDAGGGTVSKNEFDEIREEVKGKQTATQPKDNASVLAALGGQRAAATT